MSGDQKFRVNRRAFLGMSVAGALGSVMGVHPGGLGTRQAAAASVGSLGIPGPFPGRVVEVHHPGAVVDGRVKRDAVSAMVDRGMRELTGVAEPAAAWGRFVERGDVVGIKVNPVGFPNAISSYALVHTVVERVKRAGVKPRDIIVFDRYRDPFLRAGYADNLPDGVRWDAAAERFDDVQLGMDGYDPDVYRELELVSARFQDSKDDRTRRSHVSLIVSRQVNKIINLPVLKDHCFAGVTLALKNMSHGFVNNVARTHANSATNACNLFIPAIVSLPVIRSKVVLHILDGTRAVFDGGPNGTPATTWTPQTMYFATDPVALDRVGWEALDAKRSVMRLPPVADVHARLLSDKIPPTPFAFRQPQHIALAGALGLGVFERERLKHPRIVLGESAA